MSSKNTTNCESNTYCVSSSSPNIKCAMSDDLNTAYEEIDTNYGEPSINCTLFDNSNVTTIANDNNTAYEKNNTTPGGLNCNYDILSNSYNESNTIYEDVDTVHDEYEVPDTPPPSRQQVDAIDIHNNISLPQTPDEPNTVYAEYDELDAQPSPGVQVNATVIYNAAQTRIAADTRRPALPCPAHSDQDYAEATHSGIASWLTKKRIQIAANIVLGLTIFIAAIVLILKRNIPAPPLIPLTNQTIGTVFKVNASTMDYHATFVEHIPVNIYNASNYTFRVAQSLETFEIIIYPINFDAILLNKSFVLVNIEMLTGQQKKVDLVACYSIKIGNGGWNSIIMPYSSTLLANETLFHYLPVLKYSRNDANKTLDDSGICSIKMTVSYLIHSQRAIATSQAKFNPDKNTSVNMSYTWTLCNLTLPMVDHSFLKSEELFVELGVAEFYIEIYPGTEHKDFVSMYSHVINMPPNITLPFQTRHTCELINRTSPTHAVIDQHHMIYTYHFDGTPQLVTTNQFKYADFVKSTLQQCVTLKYHVEYYKQQ